ncbi:MAG: hypothetical protein BGO12_23430 [Verrucomicrobia bacterium 61-8]|nr:MAG: hypothetical protein BGO12_23430 [Verrucomicrobia bacterium 61-8]
MKCTPLLSPMFTREATFDFQDVHSGPAAPLVVSDRDIQLLQKFIDFHPDRLSTVLRIRFIGRADYSCSPRLRIRQYTFRITQPRDFQPHTSRSNQQPPKGVIESLFS